MKMSQFAFKYWNSWWLFRLDRTSQHTSRNEHGADLRLRAYDFWIGVSALTVCLDADEFQWKHRNKSFRPWLLWKHDLPLGFFFLHCAFYIFYENNSLNGYNSSAWKTQLVSTFYSRLNIIVRVQTVMETHLHISWSKNGLLRVLIINNVTKEYESERILLKMVSLRVNKDPFWLSFPVFLSEHYILVPSIPARTETFVRQCVYNEQNWEIFWKQGEICWRRWERESWWGPKNRKKKTFQSRSQGWLASYVILSYHELLWEDGVGEEQGGGGSGWGGREELRRRVAGEGKRRGEENGEERWEEGRFEKRGMHEEATKEDKRKLL